MNWRNTVRRLTELGMFLLANPIYPLVIAGVVAILLLVGGIRSCNSHHQEKKISDIQENITIEKVEANSLTNQKENVKREVSNAQTNANQAVNDFNDVLRRDSDKYESANAGRRFCEKFPQDSTCR